MASMVTQLVKSLPHSSRVRRFDPELGLPSVQCFTSSYVLVGFLVRFFTPYKNIQVGI